MFKEDRINGDEHMNKYFTISITDVETEIENTFVEVISQLKEIMDWETSKSFFNRVQEKDSQRITLFIENMEESVKKSIGKYFRDNSKVEVIDSVEFYDLEEKFGKLGNEILADFYKQTNNFAIQLIEQTKDSYEDKLMLAIDTLLVSANWNYDTIKRGYISFASHSNGFFTRWKDMDNVRGVFEIKYTKVKDYIQSRIKELIVGGNVNESMKAFIDIMISLKKVAKEEINNGNLKFAEMEKDGPVVNSDILYRSEFHNAINNNPRFFQYMNEDINFLSSRVFTIFTYLFLQKIGLKNIDRYLLAYYIYRSVEDYYDLDCIKEIRNF